MSFLKRAYPARRGGPWRQKLLEGNYGSCDSGCAKTWVVSDAQEFIGGAMNSGLVNRAAKQSLEGIDIQWFSGQLW